MANSGRIVVEWWSNDLKFDSSNPGLNVIELLTSASVCYRQAFPA